jgi:stress response protein YsnF
MREEEKITIPIVEETLDVSKRMVETARVRVNTTVERRIDIARAVLEHEEVEIRRVVRDEAVSAPPPVRQEGNVTIVPIVEERLVVEKKLFLVEEIHLKRVHKAQEFSQPVELARQRAEVVREALRDADGKPRRNS